MSPASRSKAVPLLLAALLVGCGEGGGGQGDRNDSSSTLSGSVITVPLLGSEDNATASFGGYSTKGDSYSVRYADVVRKGDSSTAKVAWSTRDGRSSVTVKAFQCGRNQHATIYRSDQPYKYDAQRPQWWAVPGRGATKEIYDKVCALPDVAGPREQLTEGQDPTKSQTAFSIDDTLYLPDNFFDCGEGFCPPSKFFGVMEDQLIDIDGKNKFYLEAGSQVPYRVDHRVDEAIDGHVPYTIYLNARWKGLKLTQIMQEYEGWGAVFEAPEDQVAAALKQSGANLLEETGCGVSVWKEKKETRFYSGC